MNSRIATAGLAGILLLGAPVLASCGNVAQDVVENAAGNAIGGDVKVNESGLSITDSNGNNMQIGSGVSLPSNWPSAVPTYDNGTLVMATAQGDGSSASATWTTDATADEAAKSYGDALTGAGFTSGTSANAAGLQGGDYTGNGYKVNVLAMSADNQTTLIVTAEKSDESASPASS